MCFSASASFGAGIVLSAIGVISIKKVQQPSQFAFASIPLIFAVQQLSEGFLWMALSHAEYSSMQLVSMYTFLFFAQFLWPIWVPSSILMLEKSEKKKIAQKIFLISGVVISLYLSYCILFYGVQAKVEGGHIKYIKRFPIDFRLYGGLLYVIATVFPTFFSSIKWMWVLGITVSISYIITHLFYEDYIISVWCFFASVISIAVLAIMNQIKKEAIEKGFEKIESDSVIK